MKKLILLGLVFAIALTGWYTFVQQPVADNQPKQFSSYEQLNAFVKENSQAGYGGAVMGVSEAVQRSASEAASDLGKSGSQDYSRTNIQVEGVDEADIVKTDGKYIYAVSGNKVYIIDAYPAENAKILSQIELNGTISEIFINKDRLVVFGHVFDYKTAPLIGVPEIASKTIAMPYYSSQTFVGVYDISDKSKPLLARNISIDGDYYDSRMIGDYVYVIANQPVYNYGGSMPLPVIQSSGVSREIPATDIYYFDFPDSSFIFTNIVSVNTQNDESPATKTFLMGYSQSLYVSQNNIYVVYQKRVSEFNLYDRIIDEVIIPIVPIDVQLKISGVKNSNATKYEKMQQIGDIFEEYIRTLNPEQAASIMKAAEEKAIRLQAEFAKEMEKTVIHRISVDNGRIDYKTNGEVPGHVLNQFSMDEHDGYFRIATTTSGNSFGSVATGLVMQIAIAAKTETQISEKMVQSAPALSDDRETEGVAPQVQEARVAPELQVSGPLNHIYVLDESLKIVGKLEDLAHGERIYSVRFLGEKAYMVTFRQIDPLFVIDLADPANPKVLGYLKIPGVSDYLHPYDETHVIGVGRDATEEGRIKGMKLSLFDVSDVANPKEISKYIIGERGTDSEALRDHKAFLFSKEKNLLVIPVSEYNKIQVTGMPEWESGYWQGAYVFNIDLANGFVLKGKITHQNTTDSEKYYYDYNSQIRRSLYIENALYTVSSKMIKMNSLSDLSEINKIEFPIQEREYPYLMK